MNILIIDDIFVFEKAAADSPKRSAFCRLFEENYRRRLFLAKEFSNLGANVLLARLEETPAENENSFAFRESGGISQVFVPVRPKRKSFLRTREFLDFSAAIAENYKSLAGLFRPDVVIAGGVLPFAANAAAKIAKAAGAVFITELSSFPPALLKKLGLCSPIAPENLFMKKLMKDASQKSSALVCFFPDAPAFFQKGGRVYPMFCPGNEISEEHSDEAKLCREKLFAFQEGKTFVLACANPLESGFSNEELISVCSTFGDKFALVFLEEGPLENSFRRMTSEKGATNVFFMKTPLKELGFVLSGANGVFLSENSFLKGAASESERFFSVFSAGRPVVAAAEHHADFFRKSSGTIITKPHNKDSIRLGIKTLMEMTETDRETLGQSCKTFAENNSKKNFAADYFALIDNLVKQKENKQ